MHPVDSWTSAALLRCHWAHGRPCCCSTFNRKQQQVRASTNWLTDASAVYMTAHTQKPQYSYRTTKTLYYEPYQC